MLLRRRIHPQWLIAVGLFGMALYTSTLRTNAPAIRVGDLGRGLWVGICLGLALLGVGLQLRRK